MNQPCPLSRRLSGSLTQDTDDHRDDHSPAGTLTGWEQLWAQTHALRAVADLLDRLGLPGLSLTIDDQIIIQVPQSLGSARLRADLCTTLATAIGMTCAPNTGPGPTRGWMQATGLLAGHPVKVFTAIYPDQPAEDAEGSHKP